MVLALTPAQTHSGTKKATKQIERAISSYLLVGAHHVLDGKVVGVSFEAFQVDAVVEPLHAEADHTRGLGYKRNDVGVMCEFVIFHPS